MSVVGLDDAYATLDEMAESFQVVFEQALQQQVKGIAERMRRDGEESREAERVNLKAEMRNAYKTKMDKLELQLEAEQSHKSDREEKMVNETNLLRAQNEKLMEMLAPLEVWARVILPDTSSAANKKAVNRQSAWRIDGRSSICTAGVATNDAVAKKKSGSINPLPGSFKYDRVFDSTSKNSDVYNALSVYVKQGVESKHLMLIMYGRSGTGKSQTLIKPYKQELASGKKHLEPPLIKSILESAFAHMDGVSARITCLEYRSGYFYDLGAEKEPSRPKADPLDLFPGAEGKFRIKNKTGCYKPAIHTSTSADDAISHIQTSDKRRGEARTDENDKSSRGHAWYEVRMCRSNKNKDDGGQEHEMKDADLGVYTFFDLGGLERLQTGSSGKPEEKHGAKKESSSLIAALEALKTPFRAIAARETEWEVPGGNTFVRAITNQLKGTGQYDKFGRPRIIVLGQVNGYEEKKEESREVLDTLQSWRTLR